MNFVDWEPVYERLLADFGYDRAGDERARDILADLTRSGGSDANPGALDPEATGAFDTVDGATVAVVGAAPGLVDEVERVAAADLVFAASTAADVCLDAGIGVDCMVTDLDKNPGTARELTREGVPVAAHAHGDNVPAVREWVPQFDSDWTLPTTQAAPVGGVRNYGGFTDGDRAAFLADAFGAEELLFVGWAFDDPDVTPAKARKLRWAERLLYWLETRRGERFGVLDGRRESLVLP
ncbi:6-hydroxymethylpterin diphosphokinase MptE-like protein [Halobium salinum]|uniref:6-hydroxymethyl-7,8-dihydropterin pyrophosphokinase n=1 Tax=Halobium salinum TaxID=1364940 RepID=A0ABD5PED0_9EURY|nr:6-hydroxymethylpterin diphosphokinase MptE-like protein [Halobium salinum]